MNHILQRGPLFFQDQIKFIVQPTIPAVLVQKSKFPGLMPGHNSGAVGFSIKLTVVRVNMLEPQERVGQRLFSGEAGKIHNVHAEINHLAAFGVPAALHSRRAVIQQTLQTSLNLF